MRMARLVASPSTSGGRDCGWPSGPVTPALSSSCCIIQTRLPSSQWTVQSAPRSRARAKLCIIFSASSMISPL